jgi:hypothetical protein
MAQYGYSTPYSGQQVAPLPPGYMEAATAPGRNLAMGITAIGQGLGKALERYTENKKAHEAADQTNTAVTQMFLQQMENDPKVQAVRYFEDTGQLPTGVDETTLKSYEAQMKRDAGMISNLVGSSAKWADMSLTKKKTALGDTVTMLNQYRTNQQDDFKNEATRQQLQKGRYELEDIISARKQKELLSGAIRFGMGQPQSETITEDVSQPVSVQYQPEGPFAVPAQTEQVRPERYYTEPVPEFRPMQQPQFMRPEGLPGTQPSPPIPQTWESVLGAGFANQLGTPVKSDLFKPTTVENQGVTSFETTKQVPVTSERQIPYEQQSQKLMQYLVQQGAKPETLAMVPQILSMVGQQRPMQIESKTLPSGITVVRADGKIDILAAPKPIEGKPLNESQGKAASFAAGMKLNNDTINSVFKSGYSPKSLTELGFMPERLKTDSRKSYETSRDAWIENFLRDRSGAVISPEEYPATEKQYFPMAGDSEKIVKQKEAMRIDAMNNTMKKAGQHADDYVNQISNQPKSGVLKYNTATKRFE